MIREQGPGDRPALEAILTARIEQAMFPLTNLRAHGLLTGDFPGSHPHASRVWRSGDSVIALTRSGMILPLLDGTPDLSDLKSLLHGLEVTGAIGPTASVRPILSALGIDRLPTTTDRNEPGFTLDLQRLRIPDLANTSLRPLTLADVALVTDWRETYLGEVMGTTGPRARATAQTDVASYLAQDSHRILQAEIPVAMTGFNATMPEIVQVGGVYTPANLRGRGYARRAVALHLAEARDNGTLRAVLFAASDAAARAYQAIGFQPAAAFTLFLLAQPQRIAACP
jgi:RimJ/RimL family protein N-acetyltransferase